MHHFSITNQGCNHISFDEILSTACRNLELAYEGMNWIRENKLTDNIFIFLGML